ncbi:MAG: hypothetical protein LUE12_01310 [Ruminococcus sp.]|nr:hypothetical protein [Ruminococcus sp.]
MNFFNVGFVLCAIDVSFSSWINYALKLLGAVFMFVGIREAQAVADGFERFNGQVVTAGALSVAGLAAALLYQAGTLSGTSANVILTAVGFLSVAAVVYNQYSIIKHITPMHELVNDPSLLDRLSKLWKRLTVFRAVALVCETAAHCMPDCTAQAVVQFVMLAARIIMYVYVFFVAAAFNRVRMDFNVMHPV